MMLSNIARKLKISGKGILKPLKNKMIFSIDKRSGSRRELKNIKNIIAKASKKSSYSNRYSYRSD